MRILTFSAYYLPGYKGGGPIKTIKNLFDTTGNANIRYRLITGDRDLGDTEPFRSVNLNEWNHIGNAGVYYASSGISGLWQIKRIIDLSDYDVIYVNSFFSFRFSIFPQILSRLKRQVVIVGPRGEFSVGALKEKLFKKKFFIVFYKLLGFQRNVVFQASSEYEAKDIKRVLGTNVDIKIAEDIGAKEFTTRIEKKQKNKISIVFISRISPKKNLLQAIDILKKVKEPVDYDIYGPVEDKEYWVKCEAAIKKMPSHVQVRYKGLLKPDQVINTMASYDMFFMPTLGENYGHVIAEAFCAGLPALISDTTPWRQLEEKGIGWDIPLCVPEKFVDIINKFAILSDEKHAKKSAHVLDWAKDKFSQRDAMEANISMFKYAYEKSRKK